MVTEQDVIEYLNKASRENKELTESTKKYIQKLKELEKLQGIQQDELVALRANIQTAEENLLRTRGAISVLLELAAEEEGLFNEPPPTEKVPDSNQSDE